jgi:arylsulfatase
MRYRPFILAMFFVGIFCPQGFAQQNKKPNIIVILADDLGYSDIGCYGGEIKTPQLDKLAKHGLRFTNFFNTARCCPSRASLMTGLYSHQAGVGHMTDNLKVSGYQGELHRNCVTIAEVLRLVGYRNYMVGKWHLSNNENMKAPNDTWPLGRGFDRFYGTIPGAGNYFRPHGIVRDKTPIEAPKEGFYYTDAISDNAVQFIRDHKKDHAAAPFFLYVAYTAPHWPLHALKEDIARYRGKYRDGWDTLRGERHKRMIELGVVDPKWKIGESDAKPFKNLSEKEIDELDLRMAIYAAQVDRMNHGRKKPPLKPPCYAERLAGLGQVRSAALSMTASSAAPLGHGSPSSQDRMPASRTSSELSTGGTSAVAAERLRVSMG